MQFGHHQFVLGGRKLRHKDTGSVMSSASGNLRICDLFCLELARESLAHAGKLPALPCWRQTAKGKGQARNVELEKQAASIEPETYSIKKEKEDCDMAESLQNYSVTSTSPFIFSLFYIGSLENLNTA